MFVRWRASRASGTLDLQRSADLRYQGQSATLTVAWTDAAQTAAAFEQLHESRYRHRHERAVELVNIRVAVSKPLPPLNLPSWPKGDAALPAGHLPVHGYEHDVPHFHRNNLRQGQTLHGPALITEDNATTFLDTNWHAQVDELGNLRLAFHGT
jgi:N-methylhydantoinase A/oxoprolinase/acetone carboxylase beta subunit